ncbi:hypothetical protein ITP53_08590 [Nonomuraea sp. K274]|uniref:Uncharacterized protein n=1 Tax=Nonomuraea cypriaca TaxID=1187855 RepID=A0A931F011_9ACTN|nr:hypothetical protein [Nonomuraea cypriaca]MBF8185798.1 hypothetical protein [Nonomuraea cypriaca]
MSSPDENTPKNDPKPMPDAVRRPPRDRPVKPKPAGQEALERALSESGKNLKDLT